MNQDTEQSQQSPREIGLFRVGRIFPINVYEGDRPVFQCHTPEDAARFVDLLNRGESLAAKDRESTAERPACAAIKYGPIILSGHRHSDCLGMAHLLDLKKTEGQQGFMTTLGRFVDRKEALALFVASGRVSADPQGLKPTTELYSEDLY